MPWLFARVVKLAPRKDTQELMEWFHIASASGIPLSPEDQRELEQLVDAEWQAAIARGSAILKQIPTRRSVQ